jgi:hypothetical protein
MEIISALFDWDRFGFRDVSNSRQLQLQRSPYRNNYSTAFVRTVGIWMTNVLNVFFSPAKPIHIFRHIFLSSLIKQTESQARVFL